MNSTLLFVELFEKYEKIERLNYAARNISNIYIWILFPLGVSTNILAAIAAFTMQPVSPATFLVGLLAVLDGGSVTAKIIGHQLVRNNIYVGTVGCKFEFILMSMVTLANWVLVLICAERLFTVCLPGKKSRTFTMRNCYVVVAVMSVIFLVLFGSIFGVMRAGVHPGTLCGTYREYVWFWINVWYWIHSTLFLFLPCLFMIPMTIQMVRSIFFDNRRKVNRQVEDAGNERERHTGVTETELATNRCGFTVVIILAPIVLILLSAPACVFYLFYNPVEDDDLAYAQVSLFEQIQFLLLDSTHVVNFFLYFVSAVKFRQQALRVLSCRLCRKASYSPNSAGNS